LPVTPKEDSRASVLEAAHRVAESLRATSYGDRPLEIEIDQRDLGGGIKKWEWIKMGVPVRLEIGPRDLEKGVVALSRRDRPHQEKEFLSFEELPARLPQILDEIQTGLLEKAKVFRDSHTRVIDTEEEFRAFFTPSHADKPEIHGGFAAAHWDGSPEVEERIKQDLKVTIRCLPFEGWNEPGTCPFSGKPSPRRVLWAKSY
jgi:prolyl-tRNA synthetase